MINWQQHQLWLSMMAAAFVVAAGSTPLLDIAQQKATANLTVLQTKNADTEKSLQQFQSDSAEAESMKDEMDATEAEKQLAPVDRLHAAQMIEHRAQEAHLTHFTYNFSPEEKMSVDTVGAGKQELATSMLTINADVPTDNAAYLFLDTLAHTLPGRVALRHVGLQRVGDGVTAANIHLSAQVEWLSNGAVQNLVGNP